MGKNFILISFKYGVSSYLAVNFHSDISINTTLCLYLIVYIPHAHDAKYQKPIEIPVIVFSQH